MKILHCINSVNPKLGGPIEGLKQLALVNQRFGHEVDIVSMDAPSDPWVSECPFTVYATGPSRLGIYGYTPKLVPWLRANGSYYDAVIVNGIWMFHSLATWVALAGTKTPYFVYTHGMLDPWFKDAYPLKHLKKWLYWPWADYRVLRDARAVFFTCEEERLQARKSFWLYKCDEHVVKFGTAGPVGDPGVQRAAFAAKFPHLSDKRCVLSLGRVHVKKGPDLLLKAFAKLIAKAPRDSQGRPVHLVMAGPNDHPYGLEMLALAKSLGLGDDVVTWTGMVQGDLKWGAFRSCDAFILPSHQENFGIAVAEALACGQPVLISDKVNIWREIEMDCAGFVATDTEAATLGLLERWLATPLIDWQEMQRNAVKTFNERFHIEQAELSLSAALDKFGVRRAGARPPIEVAGG